MNNSEAAAQLPRNKDGSIRKTFVKSVARRIEAADGTGLKALVGSLHESDMGALIEALPADQRQRLVGDAHVGSARQQSDLPRRRACGMTGAYRAQRP